MVLVYHPGVTTIPESSFWTDDDPGDTTALGSLPIWGHCGFGVITTLGPPPPPGRQHHPPGTPARPGDSPVPRSPRFGDPRPRRRLSPAPPASHGAPCRPRPRPRPAPFRRVGGRVLPGRTNRGGTGA